jgi:hypothetical protein
MMITIFATVAWLLTHASLNDFIPLEEYQPCRATLNFVLALLQHS